MTSLCELIGGGSNGHVTLYLTCLLLLLTAPMYTMLSKVSEHTIPVAIVDCTHIGSAIASSED